MQKRKKNTLIIGIIFIIIAIIFIITAIIFLPTIKTCGEPCTECTNCGCIGEYSPVLGTNMKIYTNSCFACLECQKYFKIRKITR